MPSDPDWTFSLTTPFKDVDSDDEGHQEGCRQKLDDQLLKDLDLSSREEAARYTPNPFSIAKINAAARSRNVPSVMVTNLQGFDPVIQSEKHVVSQRQVDIREAFRRQAQRSHVGAGLRQTGSGGPESTAGDTNASAPHAIRAPGKNFKSITDACLWQESDDSVDFSAIIPDSEPTMGSAKHIVTIPCNERDDEAHICSDFSTGPDSRASWQTVSRKSLCSEQGVMLPALPPFASPVREFPKRLTVQPSFIPPASEHPGRKPGFSSPIFGRLPKPAPYQNSKPGPVQRPLVAPLLTDHQLVASAYSRRGSRSLVEEPLNDEAAYPVYAKPTTAPDAPGFSSFHPPIIFNDDFDLASDDTLVASPVQTPILLRTDRAVETRHVKQKYSVVRGPDEEWSTFPEKKKVKKGRRATKDIRSTGPFRLPGLSFKSGNLGMSATSEKRVITFLPPPLTMGSKGSDVHHATLGESTKKVMIKPLEKSSSPTSDDYHSQDIRLSIDTGSIARRYTQTQTLRRDVRNSVHLGTKKQLTGFTQ